MRRDRDGSLVLIDFGAVKDLLNVDKNGNIKNDRSIIVGTPGYMAPEQCNGLPKEYSDIYSVGKLAIQALTGLTSDKLPFRPEDLRIFLQESKINISPNLESWLCKEIAIDTTERYADAAEALQALLNDENSQVAEESSTLEFTSQPVVLPEDIETVHIPESISQPVVLPEDIETVHIPESTSQPVVLPEDEETVRTTEKPKSFQKLLGGF